MAGFFDNLEEKITSPLFLAGAGLLSGEGFGGAMQGMKMGAGMQDMRRKQAEDAKRQAAFQQLTQGGQLQGISPDVLKLAQAAGPDAGFTMLAGAVPKPRDALDERYKLAQINALNRQGSGDGDKTPAARAALAQQLGLDPNSDGYKSYVMTGKLPREDQQLLTATDKKAMLEADELVASNASAVENIKSMETLNKDAYGGWFAGTRAALGNNLPDWAVPDKLADPKRSLATSSLDNLAMTNALTQLKAIFGGAPTEGERSILLQLQGAADKTPGEREKILGTARDLAQRRLEVNQRTSEQLRAGTYYKPGGGPTGGAPAPAGGVGGAPVRARNPQTGETIEWDGKAWVPVR